MLTNFGSCVQKNGETVEGYCACLENIFIRIQKMRYKDVNELHMAYTQRGFLRGTYGEHEYLEYIQDKLEMMILPSKVMTLFWSSRNK